MIRTNIWFALFALGLVALAVAVWRGEGWAFAVGAMWGVSGLVVYAHVAKSDQS